MRYDPAVSFLRSIFGPSREEIWRALSQELNARYVDDFWGGDKVVATYKEWELVLDTYTVSTGQTTVTYTRMRAPYVNKDGFRFTIYRASIFSGMGKFLGMQDITIGDPVFDGEFIIKSNSDERVRRMLSNPQLKELFRAQPQIRMEVKNDEGIFARNFPDGVDLLQFSATGVIKDMNRLRNLFTLFAESLNTLCHIGSAYQDDPGLRL